MKKILSVVGLMLATGLARQGFAQTNIFPSTGKVGIGTVTPTQAIDVATGNIRLFNPPSYPWGMNINVNYTSAWNREFSFTRNDTGKLFAMGVRGAADGTFSFGYIGGNTTTTEYVAAPWMVFNPAGKIGVNVPVVSGAVAPLAWFDIRSLDTANAILMRTQIINRSNTQMYMASFPADGGGYTGWKNHNVFESYSPLHISSATPSGCIYFETGRTDYNTRPRMVIDPTGNVAIGTITNSKGYKLAVEGTVGARKVKVTSESWADFVFDKHYQLPTLQSVEQYIATHGHLEGVPSTEDVVKDGVDVGDMNKVLLQKVEELTLYMIALRKDNAAAEQDNTIMKEDNKTLQQQVELLMQSMDDLKKQNQEQQARINRLEKAAQH